MISKLDKLKYENLRLQQGLDNLRAELDEVLSDGDGFWGRSCARLVKKNRELQAELDKHRWKKQIPNEAGCWLRINARGSPEMSVVFRDSFRDNKLSIYWGWSPQSKQLIENIKNKLATFYWYGPIILPGQALKEVKA